MVTAIDFNAVRLAAAVLFLLTSAAVWVVLHRQHDRTAVALWALGGLGFSVAMLGRVDNDLQVRSVWWVVTACTATWAFILRGVALRRDLGFSTGAWRVVALCVLTSAPLAALAAWGSASSAALFARGVAALLVAALAWYSWQLGRRGPSRNGLLLAAVEVLTLGGYLLICVQLMIHWDEGLALNRWDYAVFSVIGVINAAYSNVAYVGLVLDRSRVAERFALDAQAAELVRRETAESGADALRAMLHQRDRLAAERGHLLQVLAHEIRQPLHNANAALQSASLALRKMPQPLPQPQPHPTRSAAAHPSPNQTQAGATLAAPCTSPLIVPASPGSGSGLVGSALATDRVQHAQWVLSGMQSVLENTLAVSSLLVRDAPLTLQEVEIDFLLDLALGDLPEAERSRVVLQRRSGLRSVDVEPGLVRLALRNLLRNAFGHGGPAVVVNLCIDEQQDPPALLLSVVDNGVGISAAQLQLLSAGAPTPSATPSDAPSRTPSGTPNLEAVTTAPQRGTGLFIVRRVMALHKGSLKLAAAQPHGLCAHLVFPLPADEATAAAA